MGSLLLSLVLACALASAAGASTRQNPITRVVELMEGLQKKIAKDGEAELALYDKFVCWYQTVESEKTAANEEAKDRIESLNSYIDDIKSGRVEYTTERKDLEAQVTQLSSEIMASEALREKQHEDYEAAVEEMDTAITSLEDALDVFNATTAPAALLHTSDRLKKAMELGKQNLGENDARFLERALSGDVPVVDWKQLNKDTTFQKQYKAQSGKITEILGEMLQTFKDNKADAVSKESEDATNHETLLASKKSQLSAVEAALAAGESEGGARSLNLEEAKEAVELLEVQVSNDKKYIKEAKEAYEVKAAEWKERKKLRAEEIAAIGKAIEVLRSDDARDLLSASFKSQTAGLLLLEDDAAEDQTGCSQRKARAMQHLRDLAAKHGDGRLTIIALQMQLTTRNNGFDNVIASIDKMISDLKAEYEADLEKKTTCMDDRLANSKIAKQNAQAMDDQSALILRKQAVIDEKNKEVAGIDEKIKEYELQMEEAKVTRKVEALEHAQSKSDDEAAIVIIGKASKVLGDFYSEASSLVQVRAVAAPAAATPAGEAPPPPPATWSNPSSVASEAEGAGIVSILDMIKADVRKDLEAADAMEARAIKDHEELTLDTQAQISSLQEEKSVLLGEIGAAEEDREDAKETRAAKKSVLDGTLGVLKGIAPSCDFMAANFELRKANREAEIDGLVESKLLLRGGSHHESSGFLQGQARV